MLHGQQFQTRAWSTHCLYPLLVDLYDCSTGQQSSWPWLASSIQHTYNEVLLLCTQREMFVMLEAMADAGVLAGLPRGAA